MELFEVIGEVKESNLSDECKEYVISTMRKEKIRKTINGIEKMTRNVNVPEIESHEGKNLNAWVRAWTDEMYRYINTLKGELFYDKG